ncbi:amidohydrolase family protein [Conexibacter sp. CPCC 206217]|uniref:amidohydrolase family protein n=1 Tax=Conexibacter sp. CPCC 206217 TaxID=3064574 RepID=UPI002724EA34|nr:amidohydrolase family protein [Conexibacter sp. CPCC 206217]MDO8213599.1 amidohydrolase family protein [Conexibacter sp. CPCC 206217]
MSERRYIALEEHALTPGLHALRAAAGAAGGARPSDRPDEIVERMLEIGSVRIAAMDAAGVDVQVLSHHAPGAQLADPARAVAAATEANDELAAAIASHPTRFAGWATVPTIDPDAAAAELKRCVEQHGFVGAMVHGQVAGGWLDHPRFDPLLRMSTDLGVPLYLHPAPPPAAVKEAYYSDLDAAGDDAARLSQVFATSGWGWHVETGGHALRMVLNGVFDRHPSLDVILGHWGELVPFYLGRIEERFSRMTRHLRTAPAEVFATRFHVTPAGLETIPPLLLTLQTLGADRIMYSADYPFSVKHTKGRALIEEAPISEADKSKIAHLNAERLLRLP